MSEAVDKKQQLFQGHGCHIKVNNINSLKVFYRDIIGLGNPLVDSNFWVEFPLPQNGLLVLEQVNNVVPEENKQDVCCLLVSDDFEGVLKRLEEKQINPLRPSIEIPGRESLSITDPEYNVITVLSALKND